MTPDAMNWTDRLVATVAPGAALRRVQSRMALRYYDAAQPSPQRMIRNRGAGPNRAIESAGGTLRDRARDLERNLDLASGILDCLVDNTVGPGIVIEPTIKNARGEIHDEACEQVLSAWNRWERHADLTGQLHFDELQRLAARALFRDGEFFLKTFVGELAGVPATSEMPFSLECLEADWCPFSLHDDKNGITQGVERNGYGVPRAYHFLWALPGETRNYAEQYGKTRRVTAFRVLHARMVQRFGQIRGASQFAAVLNRLQDIDEIESTERIAAKVAASFTAYIRKGSHETYNAMGDTRAHREIDLEPGLIIDDLEPGEDIGIISSNRPNNALVEFRASQLKAVAAGSGTSYSTIARDYSGTYSSQRQALVEAYQHYRVLTRHIIQQLVEPIYRRWLDVMVADGVIRLPGDVDVATRLDVEMRGPAMPWIDPVKEANGEILQISAGLKSRSQSIRERGGYPRATFKQIQRERARDEEAGLHFCSTDSHDTARAADEQEPDDEEATKEKVVELAAARSAMLTRDADALSERLVYRDAALGEAKVTDEEQRTVRVSFSSERKVLRRPLLRKPFYETLGHGDGEADLSRLNAGAQVLFNHEHQARESAIGVVERAWIDGARGYADIRFSRRAEVDGIWQDVKDRVLRNVSVGYAVERMRPVTTQTRAADDDPEADEFRVTRWVPMEISLVTIPADASVGVGRSESAWPDAQSFKESPVDAQTEAPAADTSATDTTATRASETLDMERMRTEARQQGRRDEAARRAEITAVLAPFAAQLRELDSDLMARSLADEEVTPDIAGKRLLKLLGSDNEERSHSHGERRVEAGEDQRDKTRVAMSQALEHRCGIGSHDLAGNEMAGFTLAEMARESLRAAGQPAGYRDRLTMVGRALTTSDFPTLLSNTATSSLLRGYEEADENYAQIVDIVPLTDFRPTETNTLGTYDDLEHVPEGGEYRYHGFEAEGETMKLATYGSICALTRQAIINDNVAMLTTIPLRQGRAARRLVGDQSWGVLTENAKVSDGKALFHVDHKNLAATGTALSADSLAAARLAMLQQKDAKKRSLAIRPTLLIVPETLRIAANQLMNSANDPANANVANPVAGLFTVVSDPRLDDDDPGAWYLMAAPASYGAIGLGLLNGSDAPFTDDMEGWRVDGIELKVRIDVVAKATNYRAIYKNPGV